MKPPFSLPLLGALLFAALAAGAAETVVYAPQWGAVGNELDGWTVTGKVVQAAADAKSGNAITTSPGAITSKPLPIPAGHRIHVRFTYSKSLADGLYGVMIQFAGGKEIQPRTQIWSHLYAPAPNPVPVDLGLPLEPETDAIVLGLSVNGPPEMRLSVSHLTLVDLGTYPAVSEPRAELFTDPGWEQLLPRQSIVAENSYGLSTGGWMGWSVASMTVTQLPSQVRSGKNALKVTSNGMGFRINDPGPLKSVPLPDTWYDFSVWAKGLGTIDLNIVNGVSCGPVLLSPDEWRQIHFPVYAKANLGVMVNGLAYLDDLSYQPITPVEMKERRAANRQWPVPPVIAQSVPPGETRSSDLVVLENACIKVILTPTGGGRIVELSDKQAAMTWKDVSLLALAFPNPPVPVTWSLPFRTEKSADGRTVTFSHTVTGGQALPFLDGLRIEQQFSLGADERRVQALFRLTHTGTSRRLTNPVISNSWGAAADVRRITAAGDKGLIMADSVRSDIATLAAGWMAASTATSSLVFGFDVTASQSGTLNPAARNASWQYLRPLLPPGGSWETRAWVAPVALPGVDYADPQVVVLAPLTTSANACELRILTVPLTTGTTNVRPRVTAYDRSVLAAADRSRPGAALTFTAATGRFVTVLDIGAGTLPPYTVELFNDPPGRFKNIGIEGASQTQYAPPLPVRVLRLPAAGDLRATIGQSRRILWARGLWAHEFPFAEVTSKAGYDIVDLEATSGFPEELEELAGYRLVILSNLGACHLAAQPRAVLAQYVRAGGRLLVTGGMHALGNGQTAGTDLAELLPVELSGAFDFRPLSGGQQRLYATPDSSLRDLAWGAKPRQYWVHRVVPRRDAQTLARAGDAAVLTVWNCDYGRCMLFSGSVAGDPGKDELPAWAWADWPAFWTRSLDLLMK